MDGFVGSGSTEGELEKSGLFLSGFKFAELAPTGARSTWEDGDGGSGAISGKIDEYHHLYALIFYPTYGNSTYVQLIERK